MDRQDGAPLLNQQPQQQRKKCHGNRRNQRFRRRCRAEKMKPTKIEKLIKKRNRIHEKNRKNNRSQPISTAATNLNKRKTRFIFTRIIENTKCSI